MDNTTDYKNKNSLMKVSCPKGHAFVASVDALMKTDMECMMCLKEEDEQAERGAPFFLAIDAATYTTGIAALDREGRLLWHRAIDIEKKKEYFERMRILKEEISKTILDGNFQCIVLEDIQYQQNPALFKKLGMMQGILRYAIVIELEKDLITAFSDEWRAYNNISGSKRSEQKQAAKKRGKIIYGKDIAEDEVEAIFLGKYGVSQFNRQKEEE